MAHKRAAGVFLWKNNIPGLFDYVNSGNCQNCQNFNIYGFGTCLKRRAPKNHEFWRYSDLQISHGEPIGEQNDEFDFGVIRIIRIIMIIGII